VGGVRLRALPQRKGTPVSRQRRTLRHLTAAVGGAAALLAALVAGPGSAQASPADGGDNIAGVLPEPPIVGLNNFACKPSKSHPRPVVLVHGLGATATENWHFFAPYLMQRGFCVFALTYGETEHYPGRGGVLPMEQSAQQLADFVDEVRERTGAEQVDMVGHSEGGIMPRYYIKFLGGHEEVANFVGWAAPNHGTDINGLTRLRTAFPGFDEELANHCGSCPQFMIGSDFMQRLNAGKDETIGKVKYTVLATRYDEVVTPVETSFLRGDNVTNVLLQDADPHAYVGHVGMAWDPLTFELTMKGLGYHAEHGHVH
jgi:pimeloyl-ACP methyl ester carboxylesterase